MKTRFDRKPLFLILTALLCSATVSCLTHKLTPEELAHNRVFAEILRREDARVLGEDGFFSRNLSDPADPQVQEWCAIALGRIGDARALSWLYDALRERNAAVRAAAAFAVGEIEDRAILRQEGRSLDPNAIPALTRLLNDSSTTAQMRAIEALGKVGSHSEAVEIINRLASFRYEAAPLQRSYLDLAITALMRLRDPAAFATLERFARLSDPEIQWRALNALVRMGGRSARGTFLSLLDSVDPDVQAYAARGIGICEDSALADRLVPLLPPRRAQTGQPIPLPVRISAVQALGNLKDAQAIPAIASALGAEQVDDQHPNQVNFAIQAATALGKIETPESEGLLLRIMKSGGPAADSAVVALAQILKSDPDRFFALASRNQFTGAAAKRAWSRALGNLGGSRASDELRQMLAQSSAAAATAARRELAEMAKYGPRDIGRDMTLQEAKLRLSRSLEKGTDRSDMLALPAVIDALAKVDVPDLQNLVEPFFEFGDPVVLRSAVAAYKPKAGAREPWAPIIQAYRLSADLGDAETTTAVLNRLEPWAKEAAVQDTLRLALQSRLRNARIEAARLLRAAGSEGFADDAGPAERAASDLACGALASARGDRTVALIETARGDIEIELFREDAPLTVANFVSLAKRRFYDGLSFMRVVPFFVIQGGDPRDDQEGGPGYTIRCEINMRPYERGSVGMALSGKDTGGSQFFITLAPQPHLDGGYTCFGRVISGMQIADRIVPGDRIKKITIKEDTTLFDYRRY